MDARLMTGLFEEIGRSENFKYVTNANNDLEPQIIILPAQNSDIHQ